jgi:hypothetical protein
MTRSALATVLALAAATMAIAGCDQKLSDVAGPTPNLEPTFASIQRDIFSATDSSGRTSCVTCHTDQGRTPAAGLVLLDGRAYGALVGVASTRKPGAVRVTAGDPSASFLMDKLTGGAGIVGNRMPLNGPYLSDGQIRIIRRWIELGAKND